MHSGKRKKRHTQRHTERERERERERGINVICSIRPWCSGFAVGRICTETDSSELQCSSLDGCHLYLKAEPPAAITHRARTHINTEMKRAFSDKLHGHCNLMWDAGETRTHSSYIKLTCTHACTHSRTGYERKKV